MLKRPLLRVVFTLLMLGMLAFTSRVQLAKASGNTIRIRADGSIDPPGTAIFTLDNVTYAFTANINESIVVERDNIVLDGAAYTLEGNATLDSKGIDLSGRINVSVKNVNIRQFFYGVYLSSSTNVSITGNGMFNNSFGVWAYNSSNFNVISGNHVVESTYEGIYLYSSSNNNINRNNLSSNRNGVYLRSSSDNDISQNTIAANVWNGIYLLFSSGNSISENNLTSNKWNGVWLANSDKNGISNNHLHSNGNGTRLSFSSKNILRENHIFNNAYGLYLEGFSANTVFHNNFVDNAQQVYSNSTVNAWDNGCEGNYWSDYNGTDFNFDGVGDTPHVIDGNNTDYYPLMNVYWIPADVNHDLRVDILDVVKIAASYGTAPSSPFWNPHGDIADPRGVIDTLDLVTCTAHYGERYS